MAKHLVWLLHCLLLLSCAGETRPVETEVMLPEEKPLHYFAVVGHAYGHAENYTESIYPPFLKKFSSDHHNRPYDFLFLTGDVVAKGTDTNWNNVIAELESLRIKWYISPGNHDVGETARFKGPAKMFTQFDKDKYWFINGGRNHMLVLNTTNPGWTVDSAQHARLTNHLSGVHKDTIDNIFVFTHQLWWLNNTPDSLDLDTVRTNSEAAKEGPSDFWTDAFPYFVNTGVETWFFAGDLGAHEILPYYYEDHYDRFHFYASGVGGGVGDSYFAVSVYEDGDVEIERVDF